MVLRIEPITKALHTLVDDTKKAHVLLTSARGEQFNQEKAEKACRKRPFGAYCGALRICR